jgi:hypothetical protein
MSISKKALAQQERLNHLTAGFLRLNDNAKTYIASITRQLTYIGGSDFRPPVMQDDSFRAQEQKNRCKGVEK